MSAHLQASDPALLLELGKHPNPGGLISRSWRDPISEAEAASLVADVNQCGYATLADYISEDELEPIRALADASVCASLGGSVILEGSQPFTGTILHELPRSEVFKALCRRLYELGTGTTAPETEFYQVFRCLHGTAGQRQSNLFHYDAYVLTALLPISIPKGRLSGDLMMIPAVRPIRRSYISNVVDNALIRNRLAQRLLMETVRHKRLGSIVIKMEPGRVYFFWGYRSIHANEPSDPDKLRATALFHYGDPHSNSKARTLVNQVKGLAGPGPGAPTSELGRRS